MKDKDLLEPIAPWRQWKPRGKQILSEADPEHGRKLNQSSRRKPRTQDPPPVPASRLWIHLDKHYQWGEWSHQDSSAESGQRTVGFLRFSYPACLIYQPTSEAHTWDSMRMQLYHTIPCPYPVGLEHSEQTLINPPVSECKSWSWELWAFFFSRCFHSQKIVQGLTHTFLLLLTPGNLQCIYRLYQFFISRNISVRTLQHADFGDWPSS